ncbi:hypothetical protein G6M16_016140 [Agrobacterium tumefaciens]|uniref:hypothetical protein n=1 Tax=uncultured Agrobacterium sp. TaxID=157277 RepID=UPI00157268F6|nr:hypothetical protein [uncultured Agrobacterium sp.]WCA60701.1 hypothetical protein G6M16_016140 [Agrobacterium tumefaciens]
MIFVSWFYSKRRVILDIWQRFASGCGTFVLLLFAASAADYAFSQQGYWYGLFLSHVGISFVLLTLAYNSFQSSIGVLDSRFDERRAEGYASDILPAVAPYGKLVAVGAIAWLLEDNRVAIVLMSYAGAVILLGFVLLAVFRYCGHKAPDFVRFMCFLSLSFLGYGAVISALKIAAGPS